MNINFLARNNIDYHIKLLKDHQKLLENKIQILSNLIISCYKKKGKILIFGNGGSAADAQHFSTELTVRLKYNRRALPAISLSTDTSAITAIGNDFGFKYIFSRQIEAIASKNDLIIPISTSGNSDNIIKALSFCNKKKIKIFGILGSNGGGSKKYCFDNFTVNSNIPSRVQEIHIIFWQNVCEVVENYYIK